MSCVGFSRRCCRCISSLVACSLKNIALKKTKRNNNIFIWVYFNLSLSLSLKNLANWLIFLSNYPCRKYRQNIFFLRLSSSYIYGSHTGLVKGVLYDQSFRRYTVIDTDLKGQIRQIIFPGWLKVEIKEFGESVLSDCVVHICNNNEQSAVNTSTIQCDFPHNDPLSRLEYSLC